MIASNEMSAAPAQLRAFGDFVSYWAENEKMLNDLRVKAEGRQMNSGSTEVLGDASPRSLSLS